MIYTGSSFALCLVELLVHANRKTPPSAARFVEAAVPDDVSREVLDPASLAGWDDLRDIAVAQAFGRDWIEGRRSALLFVPSVVTAGRDTNVVVNPDHPDARGSRSGPKPPSPSMPGCSGPNSGSRVMAAAERLAYVSGFRQQRNKGAFQLSSTAASDILRSLRASPPAESREIVQLPPKGWPGSKI